MKTLVKISALTLLFLSACFVSNVKAQDDVSSVSTAIKADLDALAKDFNNLDADAVSSHYAEDAIMTVEDGSSVRGRDEIRKYYENSFEGLNRPTVEITVSDVLAIDRTTAQATGTYKVSFTDKESGETREVSGTFSILSKKTDDGSWKIVRELDSATPSKDASSDGTDDKH